MSSRLLTTPWFTKNLAGGWLGTERLLGARRRGRVAADGSAGSRPPEAANPPGMIRPVLLAIDIGNTNVTVGSFRNGVLVATRRTATDAHATADELELRLADLLRLDDAVFADVSAIALASVVPALTDVLATVAERLERPLLVASAGTVP